MTPASNTALLQNISKSFGPTQAVVDVSLEISPGSILGIVGENGAGKSTLSKIIAGVVSPDSGDLIVNGQKRNFKSPYDALGAGVAMMAQEITLVPDRTVEENVLLGSLPHWGPFPSKRLMREKYLEIMDQSEFDLDPSARVGGLRIADQQKVELMRALSRKANLIIMDEPSAALTADEIEKLHAAIRNLAESGTAVILVSHYLEEVLELTEKVAIMRDGHLIRVGETKSETSDSLVASMVGKSLSTEYAESRGWSAAETRFTVNALSTENLLKDISFDIGRGEILGLAGLVGSGRTEIARAIFGADKRVSGEFTLDGASLDYSSPAGAISQGVFMIPESRKDQGLVLNGTIRDNLVLASISNLSSFGFTSNRKFGEVALKLAELIDLRYDSLRDPVSSLSGGNQQKILFGRAVELASPLLIVDEPTRGVDIAAKRAIHGLLEELAADGTSILFISSDIEEVLGVCHRTLVVHKGQIHGEFIPPYDQAKIISAFFGQSEE